MSAPAMTTPVKGTPVRAPAPVTDSPGTWRHPRLNEITRRREASTFTEKNVRKIVYNICWLVVLGVAHLLAKSYIDPKSVPEGVRFYFSWAWTFFQILPFVQIGIACLPLVRAKDDLADIPLTAAQRKLLGLPQLATIPKTEVKYSTPPRYSRTPSIAGSIGSRGSYNNSPLSGRGSPIIGSGSVFGGSPYSPGDSQQKNNNSTPSPFGSAPGRRSSLSSGSPFGVSTSNSLLGDPASPTPAGVKRTTVGLNSKWLYEKGRRSSGNTWVH